MELELTRVDYTIVGLTSAKCMKLLPPTGPKASQKVAIGDQDGTLHVFAVRKGEVETVAKISGERITRLDLGGMAESSKDKIFVCCGSEVKGFTKKGKSFLHFDTNLTEPITTMCVLGNDLFVSGQNSFYHYHDLKDANYFFSSGIIKDVLVVTTIKMTLNMPGLRCHGAPGERGVQGPCERGKIFRSFCSLENKSPVVYCSESFFLKSKGSSELEENSVIPILACDDKVLRVVEDSHLLYAVPISSSPCVLHDFSSDDSGTKVLFGTSDGGVGLLQIGRELKNSWVLEPDSQKGQVTCLDTFDLTGDESKELIVGRDDGFIEVYRINQDVESPELIYSHTCNETVTCLIGGIVSNNGFEEILVSTYSGWVFGLTTETNSKNLAVSVDSNNIKLSQDTKQKIIKLRSEIEELEGLIMKEREKYHAVAENSENALSTVPSVSINDKFYLQKEDASYNLCIEVQTSIDNVLIQSDVPVDLLDVEKNSAVVSFSDCNHSDGNFLLATYRCQLNTTRLDLKIRTIEGQYGTLQTYVTPNIQPKCSQLQTYKIKALSLHTRTHSFDPNRPYNVLTLKGGFSFAEIHSWIEFCLPEVPEKPPPGDSATLVFVSSFMDTMLQCCYTKGEAEFRSENISTISILKDVISKEAMRNNKKKRNLDISWQIHEKSIQFTLTLLRPKLEHQLDLLRKIMVLESMSELDVATKDIALTDEFSQIIQNEKAIVEEYRKQPAHLDRLYGIITDLFIDKYKFQGVNVKSKVPSLLEVLHKDNYSFDRLLKFFNQ